VDPRFRSKATWQKQADELSAREMIGEKVSVFVRHLVDHPMVSQETWLADVPILTDDYAPVDTLKHPLL